MSIATSPPSMASTSVVWSGGSSNRTTDDGRSTVDWVTNGESATARHSSALAAPTLSEIVLTNDTKADIIEHMFRVQVCGVCMPRPPRHADFFRMWTPETAYVLGYWWADGCMRIK